MHSKSPASSAMAHSPDSGDDSFQKMIAHITATIPSDGNISQWGVGCGEAVANAQPAYIVARVKMTLKTVDKVFILTQHSRQLIQSRNPRARLSEAVVKKRCDLLLLGLRFEFG